MASAKHHFALAVGIDHASEPARHQAAALPASVAVWRMVDAVRAEPTNAGLPERAVYSYIIDRMFAGLTAPIATEEERRHVYLPVHLPSGRPPTRRSRDRQALIDEIRARPEMPDYLIAGRAVRLGLWDVAQADDAPNVKRRIRNLRKDAARESSRI